ncbi:G-type lectin S-receptor-like serine/threonine-protein kinase At4g27290 [Linum grandiflorum]
MEWLMFHLLLLPVVYLLLLPSSSALEALTPTQPLIDNDAQTTLKSRNGTFELGFFTASENRYLGIWYRNIAVRKIVWVANRESPATDNGSSLIIDFANNNSLVLLNSNTILWSTSDYETEDASIPENPVAELLDTGNLVLRDQNDEKGNNFLWQSFDYPCNTMLPGMKLGWDSKARLNRRLTAWKGPEDPSLGDFTWGYQMQSNPESVMWKGSDKLYRGGPWNGLGFGGAPELKDNPIFSYTFVWDEDDAYFMYELKNKSLMSVVVVNQTSSTRQAWAWNEVSQSWGVYSSVPRDLCDTYAVCGVYASCAVSDSPICRCLKGFKPKSQEMWDMLDWSRGCVRNKPLECSGDGFVMYSGLKLPDATNSWVNKSMSLEECRVKCLMNCSCMAYTNTDVRGAGSGCSVWYGDLNDMKQFPGGGQEIYIRMPASEIETKNKVKPKVAAIVGAVVGSVIGLLAIAYFIRKMKSKCRPRASSKTTATHGRNEEVDLPLFELARIVDATDNFSATNKLGEGGFGPVYVGVMGDGQQVAVKRLSSSSRQGTKEFKNEVLLISKLQHRNLVKLLGCCIEEDEKMLVYEYLPNKSLDSFIFGLLYLHQDSRLRIIHRDLKASNVLLDNDLNPKISDFGMARSFGGDNTEGNTNRVVGTYGYMAPEYAADGLFSVKSDVFSFGILVLEIISRKKSRGFYYVDQSLNFIGYAWKLWKEGKAVEIMDSALKKESYNDLSQIITDLFPMESSLMLLLLLPLLYFLLLPSSSSALESVTPTQPLIDNDTQTTLQSRDGTFELGFFTASKNRYLGIWYRNIAVRRIVWVANRESPATDKGSSLIIDFANNNSLVLVNNNTILWSSSNSTKDALIPTNPVVELLDTGNLVLRDQNDEKGNNFLWQSFDYPCDTLLPGMKLGWDSKSGLNRGLTSWKSPEDPSPGDFSWGFLVHQENPEGVMWKGSEKVYRGGPWNGLGFSSNPELRENPVFSYTYVWDEDDVNYTYELKNKSLISIIVMNQTSHTWDRLVWNEVSQSWGMYSSLPKDRCDNYAICGVYATCAIFESPICQCFKGFKPKSQEMWDMLDWSRGCVRNKPLECSDSEDGFVKYSGLKLPDATNSWVNKSMNLEECRVKCLMNCSCMAYTSTDIRGAGSGCSIWYGDLTDMKQFPGGGQEIYIRMPASEIETKNKVKTRVATIVGAVVGSLIGLLVIAYFIRKTKSKCRPRGSSKTTAKLGRNEEIELPLFELATIVDATDNFSVTNKLGEGGFGPVYMGVMVDGQEIAVKRLSSSSGQGTKEFKNEVLLISKLQHRNLVKLLGCCIQGDEKLLVYEYMPNKSLDSFIFDDRRSGMLDWRKRFNIICGIARGLMYLHQDSRLRIVHRDLKASNVLLDNEMNPKISDFGMAKSFGGDNTEGNTNRVVGT